MKTQTRKKGNKQRKIKLSRVIILIMLVIAMIATISVAVAHIFPTAAGGKLAKEDNDAEDVIILAYHHMVNDEEKKLPHLKNNGWAVSTGEFEQQLQFLYDRGYKTITLDELNSWYNDEATIPDKSVVITFDDGYLSSVHYAVPILKKFNYSATTFMIGWKVRDKKVAWDPMDLQTMTVEDMNDPENEGTMYFYCHTYGLHNYVKDKAALVTKTKDEILEDFDWSSKVNSIDYVAYPFGVSSDTYIEAEKEVGVKLGFEFGTDRPAKKTDNPYLMPRYCIKSGMPIENFKNIFALKRRFAK